MGKRVLMFGAMLAIAVAAVIASLFVLDVVTAPELGNTLGKTLLVIGIVTTAVLLLIGAVKLGMGSQKPSTGDSAAGGLTHDG